MQKYVRDELNEKQNAILGLGGFLAGFVYEKSGDTDEALRYYDEALAFSGYRSLAEPIRSLAPQGTYRSPRINKLLSEDAGTVGATKTASVAPVSAGEDGEIVCVVGYGACPTRFPNASPSGWRSPWCRATSTPRALAAPTSSPRRGSSLGSTTRRWPPSKGGTPFRPAPSTARRCPWRRRSTCHREVRAQWAKIEGKIILSAITQAGRPLRRR